LHERLKAALKGAGLAEVEARACSASCLDACWAGPCIAVEPDHYFYGRVTEGDVPEIVAALRDGTRVERLVLAPADFEEPARARGPA
ncbi:MAG: (2Fe-2S) ferredoxin domain-containing protein, partial [Deltaproteobacteria bacterium]|nr:(2Fe-2S) ferredoxin domain-containing protein [Deltaproteobacteria bacterium]